MKIDDFIRDTMVQTDTTTKGKAAEGVSSVINIGDILAESSFDAEFSLPDLLQSFGRMVSRRQQLMESLPTVVRDRLTESTRVTVANSQSGLISVSNGGNSIQQGVSGIVRQNQVVIDAMRQIASELEYVERVPELSEIFVADSPNTKVMLPQGWGSAGTASEQTVQVQHFAVPEAVQKVVDEGIKTLQTVVVTEKGSPDPAGILTTLLDKAIRTGTVGKELVGWIETVVTTLDDVAEDPEVSLQLSAWINRVDPEVTRMANVTGRTDLVRAWAATQAWGSSVSDTSSATTVTGMTSPAFTTSAEGIETMKAILQSLAAELRGGSSQFAAAPTTVTSRAGQFELLLSSLGNRPEALSKILTLLPELVTTAEKKLPVRTEGKATAVVYDTLARSAPKWLQAMAERAEKPELLEFWVASKMADLAPWAKLSSAERQQAAVNIKELSTTFEQPNVFRTASDDASSRGLMLQMALYAPEQRKTYPALIQIFEEKRERGNGNPPEQEVWIRVSLETDNIGAVDLSFRLQDKKYLSIFSRFADTEAASAFRTVLPEIRKEFAGTALELKKIAVTQRTGVGGETVE